MENDKCNQINLNEKSTHPSLECWSYKDIHIMGCQEEGELIKGTLVAFEPIDKNPWGYQFYTNDQKVYLECKSLRYIKDKRLFYDVDGADPQTFVVFTDGYAKDALYVYFREKRINEADSNSFTVMSFDYAMDNKQIYWKGRSVAVQMDPATFEVLDNDYARDSQTLLYQGKAVTGASAVSFSSLGWGYGKDQFQVYYHGSPVLDPIFDASSFTVLSEFYIKDKQIVYWSDLPIVGVDVESFVALNDFYGKDKNHVYLQGIKLENADVNSFQVIQNYWERKESDDTITFGENWCTKDATSVFYYRTPIENADSASFTLLTDYYAKDKNHVYFNNQIIKEADPKTFIVINAYYTKDHQHVFYNKMVDEYIEPFEYADTEIYFDLEIIVSQDDHFYYLEGTPQNFYDLVVGADPKTFEVIADGQAKDRKYTYINGIRHDSGAGIF